MAQGVARGATVGFAVFAEGLRLVLRERRLWRLAVVPFGLSLLAVSGVLVLVVTQAGALFELVAGWLPEPTGRSALDWLWVAPARVGLRLLGALLFVAAASMLAVLAYLVASVVSAPFHDALARRVEEIVAGAATDLASPGLLGAVRDGGRAVREELVRLAFFLAVQGAIGVAGLLVPGGQLLAPPAMVLFTLLFLPLDYASYALDRRRLSFREKRRWILEHRGVMLGFGVAAFGVCVVPGLNLLAMPVLVVAATLLVLRNPPLRKPEDRGGDAGTATST